MEQDIAKQKAEKIRRRTEHEKKCRLMKQANTGPAEDDEEMNERPNNTVCTFSLFRSEIFLIYMCKFTSHAVMAKPAALVQRANKVLPASTTIVVRGLILSCKHQLKYILIQNRDDEEEEVIGTRQKHSTVSHHNIVQSRSSSQNSDDEEEEVIGTRQKHSSILLDRILELLYSHLNKPFFGIKFNRVFIMFYKSYIFDIVLCIPTKL